MAFPAPTYSAAYAQAEQNANAVLIAAAINQCIDACRATQTALAMIAKPTATASSEITTANTARAALQ